MYIKAIGDIIEYPEVREQRQILKKITDAALAGRQCVHRFAVEAYRSVIIDKAGNYIDKRCFTGSVRPQ